MGFGMGSMISCNEHPPQDYNNEMGVAGVSRLGVPPRWVTGGFTGYPLPDAINIKSITKLILGADTKSPTLLERSSVLESFVLLSTHIIYT